MNQVSLRGNVLEMEPLRHTPAGVPVLQMKLEHQSNVVEAGIERQIHMMVSAIALGDTALLLQDTPLGTEVDIQGFLAPIRKSASRLMLHIQKASRRYAGDGTVIV